MFEFTWNYAVLLAQQEGANNANPLGGIMVPLMLTMLLFYFLFMLPDRKQQKELEKQLSGLKKNDSVITAGGICGVVVSASPDSKFVTIRVDESNNTRLRVLRKSITQVGPHDDEATEKKDKETAPER